MTKEQTDTITAEVQAYIKRKMQETGGSYNMICLAITRATLLDTLERESKNFATVPLDRHLQDFSLTIRTINTLNANGIRIIRDLVRLHRNEFLALRSIGKKTRSEIEEFLVDHNLTWGMNV